MGRCLRINPDYPEKMANIVDFIRTADDGGGPTPDVERLDWLTELSKVRATE